MKSTFEIVFIVASTISALLSLSVVLTGLVFANMRKRQFMQIILCISLCDMVACAVSAFGFPSNESTLCPLQSFFAAAGFKASWLWIVMLCHQMYHYVSYGGFGLRRHHMHIIVWSLSIGTTLLPLIQTSYGRDDDSGWCFLSDGRKDSTVTAVWSSVTFNALLLVALLTMTCYNALLYFNYRDVRDLKVITVFRSLYLYPLGMVVIWLPNLIVSALLNWGAVRFTTTAGSVFLDVIFISCTQNGTLTAIIFFTMSREARIRWSKLIVRICGYLYRTYCCCLCGCDSDRHISKVSADGGTDDDVLIYYGDSCDVDESVYASSPSRTQSGAGNLNSNFGYFRSNSKAYTATLDSSSGTGEAINMDDENSLTASLLANIATSTNDGNARGSDIAHKSAPNFNASYKSTHTTNSHGSHSNNNSFNVNLNINNDSRHSAHQLSYLAKSMGSTNSFDPGQSPDGNNLNNDYFSAFLNPLNPPKLSSVATDSPLYPCKQGTVNSAWCPSAANLAGNYYPTSGSSVGPTHTLTGNSQPFSPPTQFCTNLSMSSQARGSSSDNSSYRVGGSYGSGSNGSLPNIASNIYIAPAVTGNTGNQQNYIPLGSVTSEQNDSTVQPQAVGVVVETPVNQTGPVSGLVLHTRGNAGATTSHNGTNDNRETRRTNVHHPTNSISRAAPPYIPPRAVPVLGTLPDDDGVDVVSHSNHDHEVADDDDDDQ
jgi:hypothetical protein